MEDRDLTPQYKYSTLGLIFLLITLLFVGAGIARGFDEGQIFFCLATGLATIYGFGRAWLNRQ